ncbi:MAG: AAA domain-containing protein [Bacteroidales bacterium]|nr:AAA domain-containing protein [Bacteroidales bacterium]MCM1146800.1 AAA domain-containing protein [Bacteroidales bacterium]MCM1205703.1 AAA domain-containing protein [Bacillota bacterium]MCM1510767.1 AAA domain-containing protein [Clostridium sp.]
MATTSDNHTADNHNLATSAARHDTREPEMADHLFAELGNALKLRPDFRAAYNAFDHIFRIFLDRNTRTAGLNLTGIFAKTDYLLKECRAGKALVIAVNDTRVRLREAAGLRDSAAGAEPLSLEEYCRHDFRNLCEFVSLVYGTPVPGHLAAMFPAERKHGFSSALVGEYVRVIAVRWDESFIYCRHENATDGEEARIAWHGCLYDYDWSYIKDLLHEGTQLNIIRPREKDGVLYPEFIILEPDYLVDISSIARCFTSYAESPLVHLINKIQPQQITEHTILGNFAGQLLDEAIIHHKDKPLPYSESAKEFFRNNALGFMSLERDHHIHQDAMQQRMNIHAALTTMEKSFKRLSIGDAVVEPSFFSEMLGLQGRMDYLQLDFRILLEQKSGKCEFSFNKDEVKAREEHYVQLLLYMLIIRYNFREEYERNNRELHAMLLYSKYAGGLIGRPFAPELVFRALKIRNGIAAADLGYARQGGFNILTALTPEALNEKHSGGILWEKYIKPQLHEVLDPIHRALPQERAYFLRFMTFIANEHVMAKLGTGTKENSGFAAVWHDSPEEKRLAGNIYDSLTLVPDGNGRQEKIETLTLRFPEREDNGMSNFRTGDIVILYPYGRDGVPDARKTMVFRCTIEEILPETVTVRLRAAQSDNRAFVRHDGKFWAMEHDFMEASYTGLYRGMHAFLSAPKERRDLLLLQREPETDNTRRLKGDYGAFNDLSLRVKRAKDLFLIIGPPGTGKTSYGLLNTVREELLEEGSAVLLMSYTNRAVDEICDKLCHEGIGFIRIGGRATCSKCYRKYLLSEKVRECGNIEMVRSVIAGTRVVVGTTTALNSSLSLFGLKQFSLAVIDEASQILEPHLMGLLSAHKDGVPAIRKLVFIGDHKQLPAVVQQSPETSRVDDPVLHGMHLTDCRLSLFERLLRRYGDDPQVVFMLKKQGRMHRDIAESPSRYFYNSLLEVVPLPHQEKTLPRKGKGTDGIADLLSTRRMAFLAVPAPQRTPSEKVNRDEADIIAATAVRIYEMEKEDFDAGETVGIIVPYRNQIATVRNTIAAYGIEALRDITIDTVERYQGSQRRYVIYGFTVQRYYQLDFLSANVFTDTDGSIIDRKLNVAMTRAKEHLIMVGNPKLLENDIVFRRLIAFVKEKQGYFEIPKDDYVRGKFTVPPVTDSHNQ